MCFKNNQSHFSSTEWVDPKIFEEQMIKYGHISDFERRQWTERQERIFALR